VRWVKKDKRTAKIVFNVILDTVIAGEYWILTIRRNREKQADNSSVRVSFVTFSRCTLSNDASAPTGANPAKSDLHTLDCPK